MADDALSDVLKAVRMTGAVFFNVVAKAPWVAEQPPREKVLPLIRPNAEHLIAYHILLEGTCFAEMDGLAPIELKAGDVIVFTRGDPHVMSSMPGIRPDPDSRGSNQDNEDPKLPFNLRIGAEGPTAARLVCGFLACDSRPFNPLLENLPPVILGSRARDGEMTWLGELIRLASHELRNPRAGGSNVLSRLAELMFIEVVRQYVAALPPEQEGWLAGLRDPLVGKALSLMHSCPACDWGLEELARQVGSSRSEFAERFMRYVGIPPMHYLAKWRMQVASGLLYKNANIASVAAEVGYGSEASFSRAFKKYVGVPPSLWRERMQAGTGQFQRFAVPAA